ncbi:hypothetical protein ZWY2020_048316 [Hordeum vulgare]|nr:hypothetical protein ZWY2020_048316 [Hordeum vulgare]
MVVVRGGSIEEPDGVSTPTRGSANQRQGLLPRLEPLDLMRPDLTSGMLRQEEKKKIAATRSHGRKEVKEDLRPIMMTRLLQTGRPPLLTRRSGEGGSDAGGRNAPVRDRGLPAKPEETAVPVARDDASKQNLTPKRKREHHDNEKDDSYSESSGANRFGQSYRGGGKSCRLPSPEKEVSGSEESEEDNELLIESMQLDHEEYLKDSSKWIVPVPLDRGNNTPETHNDLKDVQAMAVGSMANGCSIDESW